MAQVHDLQQDLNVLREDLSKLRSDFTELAHKLLKIGKFEARVTKDNLLEQGRKTTETLEKRIEERPFMSLLSAFIVGLISALLLGKLSDRNP